METKKQNRWLIAIMCTLLMIVLGTIYAWSFFQNEIVLTFGWSTKMVAWVFSANILFLGFAAAWGGINLQKFGATKLAIIGAFLYGIGFLLGALAFKIGNYPLLILGFGIIGGIGIGLGYVTPVVSASKWFPDKQGLVTGMVVMGFGLGALLMSKVIAPYFMRSYFAIKNTIPKELIDKALKQQIGENELLNERLLLQPELVNSFLLIGIVILILGVISAFFVKQPPSGFIPDGYIPPTIKATQSKSVEYTAIQAIKTKKFVLMWLILFINVTAGIMFISFQSPLMQDLWKNFRPEATNAVLVSIGGTLIAISSLFNGIGRFFWGGMSDKIGRIQTFRLIIGTQLLVFIILLFVKNPYLFGVLVCYVLLCYGGGFGTMPSFVRDIFSVKLMPVVYGVILTAWALGGVIGPQIVAFMKDFHVANPLDAAFYSFISGAVLLAIGFIISMTLNNKPINE